MYNEQKWNRARHKGFFRYILQNTLIIFVISLIINVIMSVIFNFFMQIHDNFLLGLKWRIILFFTGIEFVVSIFKWCYYEYKVNRVGGK